MKPKHGFLKGDRVILVSPRYGDTPSNPIWDRSFGRVIGSIRLIGVSINVAWDNGRTNTYSPDTLRFAPNYEPENRPIDPNAAFSWKKMHSRRK